jgi:hypothetical protein
MGLLRSTGRTGKTVWTNRLGQSTSVARQQIASMVLGPSGTEVEKPRSSACRRSLERTALTCIFLASQLTRFRA